MRTFTDEAVGAPSLSSSNAIRTAEMVRVAIGHAFVDGCSFEQARAAILAHAAAGSAPAHVITPNAQHIVLLNEDICLREMYLNADLVVPDGISLLLAARFLGCPLPERVTGVDLFQSLCAGAAASRLRVFFLGGLPGSADLAAARLLRDHPSLDVETYCPPMGFETDPQELERVASAIRAAQPHLVFVGLGAPKQDYWIYTHGRKLGASIYMGIGGSFEMVGGLIRRAPRWVRRFGFEWLYRFWKEPRRTWRRYLLGNMRFLLAILGQWLHLNRTAILRLRSGKDPLNTVPR